MVQKISVEIIKNIAHELAVRTMTWDEPVPEFETRIPNILESCLTVPFQRFDGKDMYKGLVAKAAMLFYLLIKNHPFQNGNKRIAMTALFIFLYLNKKWVDVDNEKLYNFAVWVAASDSEFKYETVKAIEKFITKYATKINS